MRAPVLLAICLSALVGAPVQTLTGVYVAVEDVGGRPIEHLSAADFSVELHGRAVPVEKVTFESAGIRLAIVLDLTASGFWPGAGHSAATAERTFRDHLLPDLHADSTVRIGSFGRTLRWAGELSPDRAEQVRQLRTALSVPEAERTGPSPLWDAVDASLAALASRTGRKAVLLVTDGQATGNRLGLAEVADRAIAAGVSINVVFTGASGLVRQTRETSAAVRPDRPLVSLAAATGGYYAASPADSIAKAPVDALRRSARAIRSVYRVEFAATAVKGFQRLVITMRDPDHRPRAPMGITTAAGVAGAGRP